MKGCVLYGAILLVQGETLGPIASSFIPCHVAMETRGEERRSRKHRKQMYTFKKRTSQFHRVTNYMCQGKEKQPS